jgi:hypothetical protein
MDHPISIQRNDLDESGVETEGSGTSSPAADQDTAWDDPTWGPLGLTDESYKELVRILQAERGFDFGAEGTASWLAEDGRIIVRMPPRGDHGKVEEISVFPRAERRGIRLDIEVWVAGKAISPAAEAAGEEDGFLDLDGGFIRFPPFLDRSYGRRARVIHAPETHTPQPLEAPPAWRNTRIAQSKHTGTRLEDHSVGATLSGFGAETVAFLQDGGFGIERKSTGNRPGRPSTGLRSPKLVPAEIGPLRGDFSLEELKASVRPGGRKKPRERQAREHLAGIVFHLTTRRTRPVREKALAGWIGCSTRTIRNLKARGTELAEERQGEPL